MSDAIVDTTAPGSSRRRGRACRTCAIAKAKCVRRDSLTGGPCGRCDRLGKDCSGQKPSSSKHAYRKQTRIEQLEQKIDLLLAAQSRPVPDPSPPAVTRAAPSTIHRHTAQQIATAGESVSDPDRADCSTDPLEIFQSELAKHCPWVVVPATTTSAELGQEKPFLFLSISIAASYRNPPWQVELGRKFRRHLASQLLPTGEKSLDLLQGLLVAITWYQFHMSVSVHLTNLLHLAMAQAVELGLGRRLHSGDRQRAAISGLRSIPSDEESCQNQPDSLDGPRAYLGCFYFSSVLSICIKKMDPMLWNHRIEECCRLLADRSEHASDTSLLRQVRLHGIAGRIGQTLPFDEPEIHPGASMQPIRMCVKSFHRELQEFRRSSFDEMTDPGWSMSLVMNFHIVEMFLHEIGFQLSAKGDDSLLRLELLYGCLLSAKAFFDALFSTPPRSFMTYTYVPFAHLIHALAVVSKLSLLEDADWDLSHVRQVLDFAQVVDRVSALIGELEMVQPRHALRVEMLVRIASQMTQLKERYLSRLSMLEGRATSQSDALNGSAQVSDTRFNGEIFEGLDESFWQDVIVDWSAFPDPGQ